MKRVAGLALLFALCPTVAVAQPGTGGGPNADSALRVVIDAEPAHLNPVLDPDLWGYRIAHDLICEPLVRRQPESGELPLTRESPLASEQERSPLSGRGRYEPVLAERFRIDSDSRGIELWVRKGVRFHDGRPLTAFDVRTTLEMVRDSASSAPRTQALLANVVRVSILGKDVVRLDLRRPSRRSVILAALSEIDILPASHFPGGKLVHQPFNRRPVCTGPYRFVEWRRGSQIILRRYAGYWGPTPPNPSEELRFRIAVDGAQGLSLLRQGEADVLGRVMPRYLEDQVDPAVQRGRFRKVEIDANQAVTVLPNSHHPLLSQTAFRRALALLWDGERLVRDVRKGLGTPLHMPLLDIGESGQLDGSPSLDNLIAPSDVTDRQPANGIAAAESLLDEIGVLRASPSGPRLFDERGQKRPVRLHIMLPAGTSELSEVARRLAESLAKVGLKLESEPVDLGTFLLRLKRGMFELALCAWSWTGGPNDLDVEPLYSYAAPQTAVGQPHGEVTAALTALREATDPGRAATRLLAVWQKEAPLFLLYRPRQVVLLSPQIAIPANSLPLLGDFLHLRALTKLPPRPLSTALR